MTASTSSWQDCQVRTRLADMKGCGCAAAATAAVGAGVPVVLGLGKAR